MDAAIQNLALAIAQLVSQQPQRPLRPQDEAFELKARKAEAKGREEARILTRTYHMGKVPTPGKDYDDRLTVRLGCSPTTAYAYLNLWPTDEAGLRHTRKGKTYHITERAIQEWEGDLKAAA